MLNRKLLLGSTVIAGLVAVMGATAPTVALAQTEPTPPAPPPAAQESEKEVEALVVTGSRIKRNEFTSAAPIQVITTEQSTLEGLIDPAQILQSSSVATGSTQINNQFGGFVVNGGGGVNTVSLRGLGDNRTLVLMNGRRLPPAGTQGAVAAVDLNILPATAIQRYEILKDGASSIYGSDAVAGVVNVLTRTDLDGWLFQASGDATFEGGGEQFTFGGAYGKVFDRGHLMVSAEYYEQKALKAGDRDEFMCQQSYLRNAATGQRTDWYDVDTGKFKCWGPSGALWGYIPVYNGLTFALHGSRASVATEGPAFGADPQGRWVASAMDPLLPGYRFAQLGERNSQHPLEEKVDIFSPVKRYTVFAEGAYDVGFAEAYGEFLFSRRESSQFQIQQMFPIVAPDAPCSINPFACPGAAFRNVGGVLTPTTTTYAPQALIMSPYSFEQEVSVWRGLAGLRGDFGSSGWSWDAYVSYSHNEGKYTQMGINGEKFLAAIGGDWNETNFTGICPPGSPTGCYGINLFTNEYLSTGTWNAADYKYLKLVDEGVTDYNQFIAEFQVTGDLFQLPAGPLGSAFGVSFRRDELDDKPGKEMLAGNYYNLATALRTKGDDSLWEAYAEFEVPVFRGLPGIEALTANISGRYSNYDSYGSNSTYRASLNWTINSQFRVRGTYGTSFRAPALFELNLGDQGGFLAQASVDPCINYNDPQRNVSDTIKANCAAQGIPGNYAGLGSSAFIITGGGDNLKAEESTAKTIGVVWTPDFIDLNVAIDYFDILVEDEVTSNGAAVVGRCYSSANFPTDPFCSLFTRQLTPGQRQYNIIDIDASFRNIVSQTNKGVDLTLRYTQEVGPGRFILDSQYTWTLEDQQELFPGKIDDFNGVIGEPSVTGSNQLRYEWGDWTVAWTSRFVGHQGNYAYQFGANTGFSNFTSPAGTVLAEYKNHAEATWWHDIAVQYEGDDWGATLGISNIFDEKAPNVSDPLADSGNFTYGRLGTYAFATQYYDLYRGRSVFMNVSKRF